MRARLDFFFYGTLRDAAVRDLVLGRGHGLPRPEPASVPNCLARAVRGGLFPVLSEQPGAEAPGVLLRGVDREGAARLSYFEDDGTNYDVVKKTVFTCAGKRQEAWLFIPTGRLPLDGEDWDFEVWKRRKRADFLRLAAAAMAALQPRDLDCYRLAWSRRIRGLPPLRSAKGRARAF